MMRFPKLTIIVALVVIAQASANCGAQSSTDSSSLPYRTKLLPPVVTATPFSGDAPSAAGTNLVQFLSEDQAAELDRKLAANASPAIRSSATLAGFEFNKGNWSHQQLVCQAFPNYLFLLFKGDNGANDVSIFSAAVPRSANTRIRIIPIQRRGYSLFSPAAVNALAITEFNRVRAEEPASKDADWLADALCYAALTGAHPETAPSHNQPGNTNPDRSANLDLSFPPTIEVQNFGQSTVRFVDVGRTSQPLEWALTFDSKGQLLKVDRFATPAYAVKPIPQPQDQQAPTQLPNTEYLP